MIDWSKTVTDGHIHAVGHVLSALIILLLVIILWFRQPTGATPSTFLARVQKATAKLKATITKAGE